jgi:hypothetical protein
MVLGRLFNQFFRGYRIGGVQNYPVQDRPEHGQIFQAHLRRPVLPDGDTGVGPDKFDVGIGILSHPNLVEGAGEKSGEACPLEKIKRSLLGCSGWSASNLKIPPKRRPAINSVADREEVGWPDPAPVVETRIW